jgi:hypothetical protein
MQRAVKSNFPAHRGFYDYFFFGLQKPPDDIIPDIRPGQKPDKYKQMPQGNRFTIGRVLLFPVVFGSMLRFGDSSRLHKQPPQIIRRVSYIIP